MKKVFDQTVRDFKREVNKKVLKIPGVEQKILDATSNEPWGPHGTLLADLAHATRNYHEYQIIMTVIWKRINDTGKNWRHVYKALSVLEYLAAHGSERVIDEIREHAHQISTLSDFQYIDSSGRDQGSNVRRKSQSLVVLVNDKDKIQEVRRKAHANKEKYRNIFTTGGMHRPSSYSGGGGYSDDEHDDGRYGNRGDNQNGCGKERDNRDVDRYGRGGGDRHSRGSDEYHERDGYRDDEYKGNRRNDNNHFGSRSRSINGDKVHSFNEDHQHSSGQLECNHSDRSLGAPPSYEEATGEHQNHAQDERDTGKVQSPPPKEPSPPSPKASSPESVNHHQTPLEPGAALSQVDKQIDAFDEFDPRGSAAATAPAGTTSEADIFGLSLLDPISSLALLPVTADATSAPDIPNNLELGTNFGIVPSASNVFSQIADDPFGGSPFKAISQDNNYLAQQQNLPPLTSFSLHTGSMSGLEAPQPAAQEMQSIESFDFGDSFYAITPNVMNNQVSLMTTDILPPELAAPHLYTVDPGSIPPHMETTSTMSSNVFQPGTPATAELTHTNIFSQPAPSASQACAAGSLSQTGLSASIYPHSSPYSLPPWGSPGASPVSQSFPPNHLCQQGQSAPIATQADAPNLRSESGLSVPISSQVVPSSMLSQPGLPAPLVSQQIQSAPIATQADPPNLHSEFGLSVPISSQVVPSFMLSQPGLSAPLVSQADPSTIVSQPGISVSGVSQPTAPAATGPPAKSMQEDKFETKSTVWADTLSRGLVNLNISGPKTNPLADIGVDFDAINRKEKRKEKEKTTATPVSTITMGKAMGMGSGMGLSGASGLAPPSNPMMGSGMGMGMSMGNGGMNMGNGGMSIGMGMGMGGGYGGGMGQPMGMGVGMGMNVGVGMGMGQGTPMQPPAGMGLPTGPAMPGYGYNPMMGMGGQGGYGSQQQYGGYR